MSRRRRSDQLGTWRTLTGRVVLLRRHGWRWTDPGSVIGAIELCLSRDEAESAMVICEKILAGQYPGTTVAAARRIHDALANLEFS